MPGGTGCFPCSGKSEKADRHAEDIVRYAETPYSALTAVQKSESSQQDSGANHIDEPLVYVEHGKNERRNDYCKTLFFSACEHPEKVFMKSASCKELLNHHRHRIENPAGIRRSPFPKARSGRKETRRGFQKNKLDKHQKRKSCGRYDGVDKDGFFYSFYPQSPILSGKPVYLATNKKVNSPPSSMNLVRRLPSYGLPRSSHMTYKNIPAHKKSVTET